VFANGAWRNWALGITATLIVTMITNDIVFQRDTRAKLSTNEERIKFLETRSRDAVIREFAARDEQIKKLERRLELLEQRMK
jgi:hypothetical protein